MATTKTSSLIQSLIPKLKENEPVKLKDYADELDDKLSLTFRVIRSNGSNPQYSYHAQISKDTELTTDYYVKLGDAVNGFLTKLKNRTD